jgi:hypothetical protein
MNTDQTKGTWNQFVGKAKETWERLTDDDWKEGCFRFGEGEAGRVAETKEPVPRR